MSTLSSEDWRRLSRLLDEALELPAEKRAAFLEEACARDPELRPRLDRLLAAGDQVGKFLDNTQGGPAAALLREMLDQDQGLGEEDRASSAPTETAPPSSHPQDAIGPYHLMQKVGEGGMGEVWLAEQSAPVRRKVALKLIKAGMDSKEVIARFEAERQALALMDHPAIAKVFEAGATSRGLPYFAMEYVPGEPLTTYCDRHRLRTRERLDLFVQVCEGVQHAHQKGILHRDLKPSNVLVELQGDKPVPKIIDFGVAKATGARLTDKTMHTALGALIGTPEYMSPEQAELTGLDVDTRTDVYALGVMLYELLTGALPFDSKELRSGSFDELRRKIREVEPPRPSTRVKSLVERSGEIAKKRQTEPGKLASRLRGDLDWIVMKALEKDRTRRYGSPSDLAADIARHVRHEPVLAGPPSAAYRTGKFIRRHRFGVAAAAVAAVGLVVFSFTMAAQAARIARERDRANREAEVSKRVSEFMTGLFQVSDPSEARGNTITAREILDQGAERIDKELANSPVIQAQLMHTMGLVYRTLGIFEKAELLLARASQVRQRIRGPEHPDTLLTRQWLGFVMFQRGRNQEAEKLLQEVLEAQRRVLGSHQADTARTASSLAAVYQTLGRYEEAEKLMLDALEIRRAVLGAENPESLRSLRNLAGLYSEMKRHDKAEMLLRDALEVLQRLLGPDHPDTLEAMSNLGNTYWEAGRYDEAELLLREVVETTRRVLGPEHPGTLLALLRLGNIHNARGHYAEAERVYREVLETRRRVLGPDHIDTLRSMHNLATTLNTMGRYEEAEHLHRAVLEARRRQLGARHPEIASSLYNLACVSALRGNRTQALVWLRQAVESGFRKPEWIPRDPDLQSLHGHPEFERLVSAARKNTVGGGS